MERESFFRTQKKRGPIVGGKPTHRPGQQLHGFIAHGLLGWAFLRCRWVTRICLPGPFLSPPLIDKAVVGDSKQPGVEVAARAKPGQVGKRLQKRFLGQIFSAVPVVSQMIEPAEQAVPVARAQNGKCLEIALLCAMNEQVLLIRERVKVIERSQFLPPCLVGQSAGTPTRECLRPAHNDCNVPSIKPPQNPADPCGLGATVPFNTTKTRRDGFCWRHYGSRQESWKCSGWNPCRSRGISSTAL